MEKGGGGGERERGGSRSRAGAGTGRGLCVSRITPPRPCPPGSPFPQPFISALGFEPKKEEIKAAVAEADAADGVVGFDDFFALASAKLASRDATEEILKAFKLFDDDGTGKISFKNLKRVAAELGEPICDDELRAMIDEADRDGDGEVDQAEFVRIMKKAALF